MNVKDKQHKEFVYMLRIWEWKLRNIKLMNINVIDNK